MAQRLTVEIVGDSSQLERTFRRVGRQTETFGQKMGRFAKVGVFAGATAGVASLTAAFKVGFDEMAEGQKVAAQTAAALKSTGGVAGVTARQINDLATSIMQYSGADDEAVQSAENLLLTFTKIRNQAGEGNDIFNQTTAAVVDLSQALDQDLSTSAIQLGKALNDPIRGVTALRRVGISFSDAQLATIRRLEETGRTLEAQKVILQEVTREVGGSARAFGQTLPGQLQIAQRQLENTAGAVVESLSPAILELTNRFNTWMSNTENQERLNRDLTTSVETLIPMVEGLAVAFDKVATAMDKVRSAKDALPDWMQKALRAGALGAGILPGMGLAGGGGGSTKPGEFGGGGDFPVPKLPTSRFFFTDVLPTPGTPPPKTVPRGVTADQRNQWFDNMVARLLGRVNDPTSLRQQISRLRTVAGLIQQRLQVTKDITRRLKLEDELSDIAVEIRGRQDEITRRANAKREAQRQAQIDRERKEREDAQKRRDAAKKRLRDAAQRVADALEITGMPELGVPGGPLTVGQVNQAMADRARAMFDRRIGWLEFAAERADATKTPRDNLRVARQMEKLLRDQIAVEGRTLELTRRLWEVRQKIKDLNKQKSEQITAGLGAVGGPKLAALLARGLGAGAASAINQNIAGMKLTAVTIDNRIVMDGREVARSVNTANARTDRRTAKQTSGYRG